VSRIIVCDTGPLIHLSEAQAIHLLNEVGDILIPPAVATELKRTLSKWKLPDWIQIQPLDVQSNAQAKTWIQKKLVDPGEAEAIGLALQKHSDWLLTDDARARQFAEGLGLEAHGSLGMLLWATASGHVESREQAYHLLNGLKRSSLWISERVLDEAAKAIDQLISE
jgi:predicted nucleic acid-binding protein